MSQVSVAPVASLAGVRQLISDVVALTIWQEAPQTVTITLSLSNPVPVIISGEPPPKLPVDGATDEISRVEVNVTALELPRATLFS